MVAIGTLRTFCTEVLARTGLPNSTAALVAESLVDAEARGISSHGVARLPIYVERIRRRMVDPLAQPEVVRQSSASIHIDAHNAVGQLGAKAAMDGAIEKAETSTVAAAAAFNSNHCGTLSFFVRRATARGFVALAGTNAPATMAYYGGRSRAVGTNPLAIGMPRATGPPLLFDAATSIVARGKIILAAREGRTIPQGWAVDPGGEPTTDPGRALEGAVLPFAGPKGSGLAMMLDLLCGALAGASMGTEIGDLYEDWTKPQDVGHVFVVLDPDGFVGHERFMERAARFGETVGALPAAQGHDRVLLPGELEERAYARAAAEGVRLSPQVVGDLRSAAESVGADAASIEAGFRA